MSKIVFFSIPAYGHTNPTIEVVRELTHRGHAVWYYSFDEFRERIEAAGARYISCDAYLPPAPPDMEKRVGKDFAALVEMAADTTLNLDETVSAALSKLSPDCIVADSVCFWGKLFAKKLGIPFICSTTTFAFNQYTAKLMRPGLKEMCHSMFGLPRINKKMKLLKAHGYGVDNFISIIQNDNETETIVYTSKEFQPMAETFSKQYTFVGPSVAEDWEALPPKERPLIYISLGTVVNQNRRFYRRCMEALKDCAVDVVMAVGSKTDIASLGVVPDNFEIKASVPQLQILKSADVFVTHCGMNSVNESIYCGVPMVLFPQQSEEGAVAARAEELGAGVRLKTDQPGKIRQAVLEVLSNADFKKNAERLGRTFREAGGARKAADAVEAFVARCETGAQ